MAVLILLLLILAAICFAAAALRATTRLELVALGLFLWVLTVIIPAIGNVS